MLQPIVRPACLAEKSADLTDAVLREIIDCLVKGDTVKLSSFGTFTVRKKGKRPGRNPRNGLEVIIEPRRVVGFKASPILKMKLNAKAGCHLNSRSSVVGTRVE